MVSKARKSTESTLPDNIEPLPRDVDYGDRTGEVIEEVHIREGHCLFVLQRIEWDNGNHEVRPTYYKKGEDGSWTFAQRADLTVAPEVMKRLVGEALNEGLL